MLGTVPAGRRHGRHVPARARRADVRGADRDELGGAGCPTSTWRSPRTGARRGSGGRPAPPAPTRADLRGSAEVWLEAVPGRARWPTCTCGSTRPGGRGGPAGGAARRRAPPPGPAPRDVEAWPARLEGQPGGGPGDVSEPAGGVPRATPAGAPGLRGPRGARAGLVQPLPAAARARWATDAGPGGGAGSRSPRSRSSTARGITAAGRDPGRGPGRPVRLGRPGGSAPRRRSDLPAAAAEAMLAELAADVGGRAAPGPGPARRAGPRDPAGAGVRRGRRARRGAAARASPCVGLLL